MPKNIVVCCDGTSNEFSVDRTNVAKLCYVLQQRPGEQEVYYHPGLGTMEPPGALTTWAIRATRFLGLAIGYGLERDIAAAYVFLMNHFVAGDRVYIFGFSRGAYTARALTSLLHMYGLLRAGNEAMVPYAIRMMAAVNNLPDHSGYAQASPQKRSAAENIWTVAQDFKATFSVECKPYFVGLWDTVSSVGWIRHPFHAPYTANNPDIEIARHALAIDERRGFFRPSPWFPKGLPTEKDSGPKNLAQVWFPGDHSDVGGGYPEAESAQSKIALRWMVCESAKCGLLFDLGRIREMFGLVGNRYVAPKPGGPLHNSMRGFWRLLEFVPKKVFDAQTKRWRWRVNLFRQRDIPTGASVHDSAFERGSDYRSHFTPDAVRIATDCGALAM